MRPCPARTSIASLSCRPSSHLGTELGRQGTMTSHSCPSTGSRQWGPGSAGAGPVSRGSRAADVCSMPAGSEQCWLSTAPSSTSGGRQGQRLRSILIHHLHSPIGAGQQQARGLSRRGQQQQHCHPAREQFSRESSSSGRRNWPCNVDTTVTRPAPTAKTNEPGTSSYTPSVRKVNVFVQKIEAANLSTPGPGVGWRHPLAKYDSCNKILRIRVFGRFIL